MCPTQLREAGVLYTVEGGVSYAADGAGVLYTVEGCVLYAAGGVSNAAERDARAYTVRGERCPLRS